MSTECEPLIQDTSTGGISAKHPAHRMHEVLVATTQANDKNTIRAAIEPIACWRLDDLRFEFDCSFIRPMATAELGHLARLLTIHPEAPLCVFGHADPVGNDAYNKTLSGRRAQAVYGMLVRDPELWDKLYKKAHGNDDWKAKKIVPYLEEDQGVSIDENDPAARKQLYLGYMNKYCVDDKDQAFSVPKSRFLAQGADQSGKGDYHGCGEFNPVLMFSAAEDQAYSAATDKSERNAANAPNRRVVIYLFVPGSKISPGRWPCPPVSGPPAACEKRLWSDWKKRRQFQEQRREFAKTHDTFACRFYERIAAHSPCEAGVERSVPRILVPEQPGSKNWIPAHSLWAYLVRFTGSSKLEGVQRFSLKEGRLTDKDGNSPPLDCNRQAWFYFSHRDDVSENLDWFTPDGSGGLPLLGPVCVPCGPDAEIDLDIWQQNDWVIVRGAQLDGLRPDSVKMCDWNEEYTVGYYGQRKDHTTAFAIYGRYSDKQLQETWKLQAGAKLLCQFGSPGGTPMWVGTLSCLPRRPAKLLLFHGDIHALTYNQVGPTGKNQDLPGHHVYNRELVADLLAVPWHPNDGSAVDSLPEPPARCLLPGDMSWQSQGQTNNCGAYSFSAAMQYWLPHTNNPQEHDGAWYSDSSRVDCCAIPHGARTPAHIVDAADRFHMCARRNTAEDIDSAHGLKLLKLWISAGVPVLVLVEEEGSFISYHWKTVVGYDGNRIFINNSGADAEFDLANQTPGVVYDKAPIGNDVDAAATFWTKWHSGTDNLIDILTTVNGCTFIPIYPKDAMFAGAEPH